MLLLQTGPKVRHTISSLPAAEATASTRVSGESIDISTAISTRSVSALSVTTTATGQQTLLRNTKRERDDAAQKSARADRR
jgi:hypothetical protein